MMTRLVNDNQRVVERSAAMRDEWSSCISGALEERYKVSQN